MNAFAFLEYESPHSASFAVQASPRTYQGLNLRVEHKEPSNAASRMVHGFSGSPRRNGLFENHEVLAAFQRGVSMGMSQAAHAQLIPPPIYPSYHYYPSYDTAVQQNSLPASSNNESPSATPQVYTTGYLGPVPGQFSYSPTQAQLAQYQQHQQQLLMSNPVISQYQWPPTAAHEDNPSKNGNVHREEH